MRALAGMEYELEGLALDVNLHEEGGTREIIKVVHSKYSVGFRKNLPCRNVDISAFTSLNTGRFMTYWVFQGAVESAPDGGHEPLHISSIVVIHAASACESNPHHFLERLPRARRILNKNQSNP